MNAINTAIERYWKYRRLLGDDVFFQFTDRCYHRCNCWRIQAGLVEIKYWTRYFNEK